LDKGSLKFQIHPSKNYLFQRLMGAMLLLGETGRQATYYYIEKASGIKRDMWYKNPEKFAAALEKIFGLGAQLLLKAIVRELYSNMGLKYKETKTFQFTHFIRKAERYASTWGSSTEKKGKGAGKHKRKARNFRSNRYEASDNRAGCCKRRSEPNRSSLPNSCGHAPNR